MTANLEAISEVIVDCEHKTAPPGDGYALSIGTRAMKNGRLVVEACKPVSQPTYEGWTRRMRPQQGDLILAREAPVGQVIRVPENRRLCLGQRTVLIRPDAAKAHPTFLHYWLLGPDAQNIMAAQAAGATVPHLNVEDIRNLDVSRMPTDPGLQAFAAATLGGIDDLIETNRRRIELLEQMAKSIYREWFVHFRSPGHENVPLVDSPLGPIPEGWMVRPLVSMAILTMGQSPSSEYYNSERIGKPFHQGVTDFGKHFPTTRKYCSVEGRSAFDGDILVSVRAPVGRLNIACDDLTIGRGIAAVRSMTNRQNLLYRKLKDVVFADEDSMGGGTIFKAIGKAELQQIQIVCAPADLEDRAEELLSDSWAMVRSLSFANNSLAAMRDLLLPKLVTGQIDVSSVDLETLVDSVA